MILALITVSLLVLGLALFQAWTLWYVRREVARLERRLDESLDDEDLLDFQERLQGLLAQAKDATRQLFETAERSQAGLDAALDKALEAEKKLAARGQVLESAAVAAATRMSAAPEAPPPGKAKTPKAAVKPKGRALAKPPAPVAANPAPAKAAEPAEGPLAGPETPASPDPDDGDGKRSYLIRPLSAPSPARHQKIYDLSDQGLNREQIAKQAGVLPGEVDLILNLRQQRRGQG